LPLAPNGVDYSMRDQMWTRKSQDETFEVGETSKVWL